MAKRMEKRDYILLGILAVVLITVCVLFYVFNGKKGAVAEVTVAGEHYGTYALHENRTVEIECNGVVTNILEIYDGKADMIDADCPDHLCVHQRAISKENETIVCLPNQVVVEIKGTQKAEFDAMT